MNTGRRKAREAVLQALYQIDFNRSEPTEKLLTQFKNHFERGEGCDEFVGRLVTGVVEHIQDIDKRILGCSEHWRLDRMTVVDRNILRLGVFELSYCDDIPATVSINEMVELAKSFGSENSSAFVNGILDKLKDSLDLSKKVP